MSNSDISLSLQERTIVGKQVRALRRDGLVPAVIHDHGKDSLHVMAPYVEISKTYEKAGKHHTVNLDVGSKKFMALIKDVDFDPRKHMVRHVVFNAIKADEKQQTEVPVHYVEGEIPAEKAGHMVIRSLESVEIEALPKDLIDELLIDVSGLTEIGDKVTVADIKAPAGVVIITDPEHPIATVEETKAEMSEEAETEATEAVSAADVPTVGSEEAAPEKA